MENEESQEAHNLGLELNYRMRIDVLIKLGPKISEAFALLPKNENLEVVDKFKKWVEMAEKSFPNYLRHLPTEEDLKNIDEVLKFGKAFLEEIKK